MGRRKTASGERPKTVVVHLGEDLDLAQQLDQYMVSFGLDSRSQTVKAILAAHFSAYPEQTLVFQVALAAVKQQRYAEYEALKEFYEGRARLFGSQR